MKKLLVLASVALATLVVFSATATAARQPTARGSGDISTSQDFSFSARGALFAAEGHVTVKFPGTDPDTIVKGRVNCLSIVANQAYMSGNVTDVSPTGALGPVPPTDFFAFAEDNGEPGDLRDRWSFTSFTPSTFFSPTCVAPLLFGTPISTGNIEVEPAP